MNTSFVAAAAEGNTVLPAEVISAITDGCQNWDLMKSRFVHSAVNFSLYSFGINHQAKNALGDMSELLGMLNDNDIHYANMYRYKRSKQLYPDDFKNKLEV